MRARRSFPLLLLGGVLAVAGTVAAQSGAPGVAPTAELLNSERIEQRFGSYGIEVVYADATLRLSKLFSTHDDGRIMRTFAVVGFPETAPAALAAEHRAVVDGGSIGATFSDAGWDVIKTQHQYFVIGVGPPVSDAMRVEPGTRAAAHAYRLAVQREDQRIEYALIIEIHHPDYLDQDDLVAIYGEEEVTWMPNSTRRLMEDGQRRLVEGGLALSE